MHKSTEKEDDYDKNKSFEYKDFKPYKEIIKKHKTIMMAIYMNGHYRKTMMKVNLYMI